MNEAEFYRWLGQEKGKHPGGLAGLMISMEYEIKNPRSEESKIKEASRKARRFLQKKQFETFGYLVEWIYEPNYREQAVYLHTSDKAIKSEMITVGLKLGRPCLNLPGLARRVCMARHPGGRTTTRRSGRTK